MMEECPQVMQNVFSGNGFLADPAFCKSNILGNIAVQMMTNHQHVQMLIDGIDRIRAGWIGG